MQTFGKYQVVERIGEGGFGQVFKGWDPQLKRYVAIKTVTLTLPMARERFLREAEIAANLHHPAIVTIFDFGEQDGVPYLVQEYLPGEDLASRIAKGTHGDIPTRVRWLITIAEGLRFAHSRGVVHRDIKPSNVRILEDGGVRIMDFGIAKVLYADQQLTGTNISMGTSGYVAPEQLEGREIDHRADIFSLGVLAYELITGQRPFAAPTVQATLYRILTEEPAPVASLAPDCPPALSAVIERCLRKQRDQRYRDCAELIIDLQNVLAAPASMLPQAPSPEPVPVASASDAGIAEDAERRAVRRQKLVVAAGVVALLALSGWAVAAIAGALGRGRSATGNAGDPVAVVDSLDPGAGDSVSPQGPVAPGTDEDRVAFGANQTNAQAGDTDVSGTADRTDTSGRGALSTLSTENTAQDADRGRTGGVGGETADPVVTRDAGRAGGSRGAVQIDPARVLVLVRGERSDAVAAVEQAVLNDLMSRSRPVVDPEAIDQLRADDAAMRALSAGAAPATGIGREYGAGTVVVADLVTDASQMVGGFITGSAIITAKFYDTAGGALLFTEKYQVGAGGVPGKAGSSERDAITQAAEAVARQLSRAILEKTGGADSN